MPGRNGGEDPAGKDRAGSPGDTGPSGGKKQVPLRLNADLWNEIAAWAEDEFRSINGQIEYLLTEAVKKRRKSKQ